MEQGIIRKISENRKKALRLSGKLNGLGITGFIVIRNQEDRKQIMIVSNNTPNAKKDGKEQH
ncbi:MAG: hypothetical protein ACXWV1_12055 [Chitinophagaceae bacterium]